jgi:hypothetical protein
MMLRFGDAVGMARTEDFGILDEDIVLDKISIEDGRVFEEKTS